MLWVAAAVSAQQVHLDRTMLSDHFVSADTAPAEMARAVQSYDGVRRADAIMQNLPADYFTRRDETASSANPTPVPSDAPIDRLRAIGNWLVVSGLALSFSIGTAITWSTVRRQSTRQRPRSIF
jgi:hypothetical protein